MQKRLLTLALSSAFISGCGTMAKQTAPVMGDVKSNQGHLSDARGFIVKSGSGECIYNGGWREADMINVCEGIEEKVADVAEEPEPAQTTTTATVAEPAKVEAEKAPIIETVVLNSRALFSTNADALSAKGDQALKNLIAKLGDYSAIEKVEIIGHTDDRGSDEYNKLLSERRAETIKGYLVNSYSDADISTKGMGESEPVASNSSAEGRQQNRRVEIRVTAKIIKQSA